MPNKRIFIGSARETRKFAQKLEKALNQQGFEALPWWKAFPSGEYVLSRLLQIPKQVDGAVFLCTATDRTWYRRKATYEPRDNVVFEAGLFLSCLGEKRTLIVKDSDVRLPTDLNGLVYKFLNPKKAGTPQQIVTHFTTLFDQDIQLAGLSPIFADHDLNEKLLRGSEMGHRALYIGTEGAQAWLDLTGPNSYLNEHQKVGHNLLRCAACRGLRIRTFVSLGPGEPHEDVVMIEELRKKEPWLLYVPVDISEPLLQRVMNELGRRVRIPFGIHGDFEEGYPFVANLIRANTPGNRLLSIIGNIFGNLDISERGFVQQTRHSLDRSDYLVLEVSLIGKDWLWEDDPRSSASKLNDSYRTLISVGVHRRTGIPLADVVRSFDEKVSFQPGASDVDGAETINIFHAANPRAITRIRRFRWKKLLAWLKAAGFRIDFQRAEYYVDRGRQITGNGIVRLAKR
jgi:hypothetical protein